VGDAHAERANELGDAMVRAVVGTVHCDDDGADRIAEGLPVVFLFPRMCVAPTGVLMNTQDLLQKCTDLATTLYAPGHVVYKRRC
jgi:hypothetical protein